MESEPSCGTETRSRHQRPGLIGALLILNAVSATALWHSPLLFWLPTGLDRLLSWTAVALFVLLRVRPAWKDLAGLLARHTNGYTIAILAVGAFLVRRVGLYYGLPFCYGVDESYILDASVRMIQTGDLNPHRFHYPSLGFYLTAITLVWGFLREASAGLYSRLDQVPPYVFYYYARLLSAAASAVTVAGLYVVGRRFLGRASAIIGALLLAVSHLSSESARNAGFHSLAPLWSVAAIGMCLAYLETRSVRWILFAAAFSGLAIGTMYHGVTLIPVIMTVALAVAPVESRIRDWRLRSLLVLAVAAAVFLLCTPYAVLDMPNFLNDFAGRVAMSVGHGGVGMGGPGGLTAWNYARGYFAAFGPATVIAFVIGFLLSLARWDRSRLLLYGFVAVHLLFMGRYSAAFGRYMGPVEPFFLLCAADAATELIRWARSRMAARVWIPLSAVLLGVMFFFPVRQQVRWFTMTRSPIATAQAYEWIGQKLEPNALFLLEDRTPFLPKGFQRQIRVDRVIDLPADACREKGVRYIVVSRAEYTWNAENDRRYRFHLRRLGATMLASFRGSDMLQNPPVEIYEVGPNPTD